MGIGDIKRSRPAHTIASGHDALTGSKTAPRPGERSASGMSSHRKAVKNSGAGVAGLDPNQLAGPVAGIELRPAHRSARGDAHVTRISATGVEELRANPDGGYLVDAETGTTTHWGKAAASLLKRTTLFTRETEIVVQAGVRVSVKVAGSAYTLAEPGVLLLSPGTRAQVKVEAGEALVLQNERPPRWYTPLSSSGPHTDHFNSLVALNRYLQSGRLARRDAFPPHVVEQLLAKGLVLADRELVGLSGAATVRWSEAASEATLQSALAAAAVPEADIRATRELWCRAQSRAAARDHGGRVMSSRFSAPALKLLVEHGILALDPKRRGACYWVGLYTERELRERLEATPLTRAALPGIIEAWRRTTSSGYDLTGLVYRREGVAAYAWRGRTNMWNEQPSEWVVTSDTHIEGHAPFVVGASTVIAPHALDHPVPFQTLRPAESLHCHPTFGDEAMTECYMLQRGRGALLTIVDGKAVIHCLHPGDMVIVEPGVVHMAWAADGEYQHSVFQVPSTFQYGLRFKETRRFEDLGIDPEPLMTRALEELVKGTRGVVVVDPATAGPQRR